ncbi:hypothetical protein F442_13044 [Phytophthora nicotianae P10297]|uniref:Uncharacterized protein n=1 Tax=Phytophthora nicotianae P10297 TaxID=1317064 RepID=W2YWV4_PHYNI|nr:hypothetical protein F442_13044 [Phytophthora nicotianae P10297]
MARLRSSSRTKQATVASMIDVRGIDFKHLWRQLRSVGWASKRPSRLTNQWTYTSPNGQSFVGEDAVVIFAIESGLIRDGSGESEEEASGGDVVSMEGPVNVSQIDTSVALSQNTISAMFGSDRDSEPAQLEQSDQGMNVGALQHLLSGAGSNNPDNGRGSDGASVNDGGSVEDDVHVTIPIDDVNVMVDGELPDEYEAIDSSGSDSSDNSGDDIIERREYPDDAPAPDEEVARMDDAFVEGLGGTLTLDAIDKDALRRFEWSTPSSSFEAATGEYPGLSPDVAAPTRELQELANSPMMLLFYFLPKSLWVSITKETNRYQKQTANARAKRIRSLQRMRGAAQRPLRQSSRSNGACVRRLHTSPTKCYTLSAS